LSNIIDLFVKKLKILKSDAYSALRIPDFRRFLSARLITTLATQMMSVSVGYLMYELTHSPLMLGYIGLSEAIPAICVSLIAGHLIDKHNRKVIIACCIGLLLTCAAVLLFLVHQIGILPNQVLIYSIFGVVFFTGIGRGFASPANFSFLPQLVGKENLSNAITWGSTTWSVASISGLGIGGLLYGYLGVQTTFMVICTLLFTGLMFMLSIGSRPVPISNTSEKAWTRIKAGLAFVYGNKLIFAASAMDLFSVLFGGAVAILPVFAKDILFVGPEGLGWLRASMSIGAIGMGFLIAHRNMGKNAGKIMLACVAGFGVCIIIFGLSKYFWLSFACLLVAGMLDEVSVFVRSSLIQHQTPDHMKGRVSSVNSIFITSSNELGAFESGLAAELMGTVPSVVFGGCMTLLIVLFTWVYAPKLRDLDINTIK
jgi:MFS family permease